MTKKKVQRVDKRETITERVNVDTKRLYGDINVAIKYLEEMRDQYQGCTGFGLEEHWTGYEDMEMVLSYDREETDAEFEYRLQLEEQDRKWKAEEARRKEQRAKDLKDLARLKSKLGMY